MSTPEARKQLDTCTAEGCAIATMRRQRERFRGNAALDELRGLRPCGACGEALRVIAAKLPVSDPRNHTRGRR